MENKELKIQVPEGYEIDVENSSFEKIVFKRIETERWRDNKDAEINGYGVSAESCLYTYCGTNIPCNYNIFASRKLAKASIAAARLSQIIANDERFGGPITSKEWANYKLVKYVINRDCVNNQITISIAGCSYRFIAFHEMSQARLFLEENRDLINDYFMID